MVKSKWQAAQNDSISNRTGLMLMMLVLLLAFALGANGLNADVIWIDELASVIFMGVFDPPYSPAQIIESISKYARDHVPLYYFLGAGWAQLAGWSQFSMRLISLFSGVLMIAWLYRFTSDTVNRHTAIVSALLMSTNVFASIFFHELRAYTLLLLLAVTHIWCYCRLVSSAGPSKLTWILFVCSAIAMLYTHILGLVALAGLGMIHILMERGSGQSRAIMFGWGLGILCFSPYLPMLLGGSFALGERSDALAASELVDPFWLLLTNGSYVLLLPLAPSLVYAVRWKRHPIILRMLLFAFFMGLTLLFVNWRFDLIILNRMRYFLLLWIPCMILLAYGLTSLPRWRAITALFLFLWGIAGYQFGRSIEFLDYVGLIARIQRFPPLHEYVFHLQGKTGHGDYLVGFSETDNVNRASWRRNFIVDYYLQAQLGIDGGVFMETGSKGSTITKRAWEIRRDVKWILDEHPYFLFTYNPGNKPPNADIALDIIHEDYIPCKVVVNKPDLLIRRYVHPVMDCDHQPAPIEYDSGFKVIARFARYAPESEVLQILTWWEVANEGLLDEYNVSMQIVTRDWRNLRQEDRHLYELPPWNVIELSTEGLPPGDYRLMMILYHRDTGEKVSGLDLASGEAGNILPLLAFTIEPLG